MGWFNYIGLIIIYLIMIPNIIFSIKYPKNFENKVTNKPLVFFEQIGRYGCMLFMIFNIPYTYYNFWFNNALLTYIIINVVLIATYEISWIYIWKRHKLLGTYLLSITSSLIFLMDGIILLNIPLIVLSIVFAFCHISISVLNVYNV